MTKSKKGAWKVIGACLGGALLVAGSIAGTAIVYDDKADLASEQATTDADQVWLNQIDSGDLVYAENVDITTDNAEAILDAISDLENAEIDAETGKVLLVAPQVVDQGPQWTGYELDDLELGSSLALTLDDRKLSGLFDGEVEFDDEDYDAHEEIELSPDLKVAFSGHPDFDNEFGSVAKMITEDKGSVKYRFVFDDTLDFESVSEDTPLELSFLNKEIKIVSASDDRVTIELADEKYLSEGESLTADGKEVVLKSVGENAVLVEVGEEAAIIESGDKATVGDVEVSVKTIFYKANGGSGASLSVGEDLTLTMEDGEGAEFVGEPDDSSDAKWLYDIDLGAEKPYIGLKHNVRADNADEEVYSAGESLTLPNDFARVRFVGAEETDVNNYEMEFDDVDIDEERTNVLKLSGDFEYDDSDEADELVFDGSDLRYWNEDSDDWLVADDVKFADTDVSVSVGEGDLTFDDFSFSVDLEDEEFTQALYGEESMMSRDEDLLSQSGMVVYDPEDSLEDGTLSIDVPEDKAELSVAIEQKA